MAQGPSNPKIEELRFRLKADPKSRLFYPLAEELRKVSQFAEAEQVLRTGLTHHSTYLSAWASLGRVLRELGKNREAVDALSKALQLDPGNVVAARLLADAYLALGEKVEAIKKYKLVHALLPSDEQVEEIISTLDAELNPPSAPPPPAAPAVQPEPLPFAEAPEREALPFAGTATPAAAVAAEPEPLPFSEEPPAAASTPFLAEPEPGLWMSEPPIPETPPIPDPDPVNPQEVITSDYLLEPAVDSGPVPEPASLPLEATSVDDSPFASDDAAILAAAEHTFVEEEGAATAEAEPMPAHSESPFQEPPAAASTQEAIAEEVSVGNEVGDAPMTAGETAAELHTPTVETPFSFDEPLPAAAAPAEDLAENVVMADLYERQGLAEKAREIYEHILQREPQNTLVRARLESLTSPEAGGSRNPRVTKLEQWLSKVGRKEVSRV